MTPIKLDEFLSSTAPKTPQPAMDLAALGLYHAAPRENGKPLLALQFDIKTGSLQPSE